MPELRGYTIRQVLTLLNHSGLHCRFEGSGMAVSQEPAPGTPITPGVFGCTCCHPLFVFNQFGDLERCTLRPGNVHSADGRRAVLEPVVARYRQRTDRRFFRGDAAFALPELYEYLEAESYNTPSVSKRMQCFRTKSPTCSRRPVGRPPNHVRRFYASFGY